jgi:ATP-binding cassette subfamily B protein
MQDAHLFHESIAENLRYAKQDATAQEMQAACEAAQIWKLIESLPNGLDTMVGERGHRLSGGEKQRVAIARTLLKKPAMLIFDEATSALDSKTERALQDELASLARNHTTLIIAHRLSTIVHADQILVMEHGRVIERGTHQDLIAAQGAYAQMWQMQKREEGES